jgi:hypothetical protein
MTFLFFLDALQLVLFEGASRNFDFFRRSVFQSDPYGLKVSLPLVACRVHRVTAPVTEKGFLACYVAFSHFVSLLHCLTNVS